MTPNERKYLKGCRFKIKYKTKQNAMKHLRKIKKTGKLVPYNAGAYRCEFCGKWHLGHGKP